MAHVEIDLPEDVLAALDVGFDQLGAELLETAAVKWYEVGRVGREIAARIAGVSECDLPPLISSVNRPRTPNEAVRPSRVSFEVNRARMSQLEMRRTMYEALEALKHLDDEPCNERIVRHPSIHHGKLVIRDTRLPVSTVIGSLAGGMTFEEIQREYDITGEDIRAALEFAAELADDE
jgi:uncharacterized protein (DUF433 family)